GAAPTPSVLEEIERLGFEVTHGYGLTETFGAATVCAWQEEWAELPFDERAVRKARQGVLAPLKGELMVADPATLKPVPRDGATLGEVFVRGNTVMKEYVGSPTATDDAFAGGWLHTGDVAVWHAGGYIEIRDRSKDIIISGGENISALEVETVLLRHPAVLQAAAVARPGPRRCPRPHAFIPLHPAADRDDRDLGAVCPQPRAH